MFMENANQTDLPNGNHLVESHKCSFVYWFTNGHQVRSLRLIQIVFKDLPSLGGILLYTTRPFRSKREDGFIGPCHDPARGIYTS